MSMLTLIRRFLFETAFYLVMTVTVGFTIFTVGPWAETRISPVVGKLIILSHVTDPATGQTTIMAAFDKRRDCKYVGISWTHILPDGSNERVPVILGRSEGDTSSPNRPLGRTVAGPWILPLSWDEIEHRTFAELYHQCWPFWVSTTEFYP